jgi:uncharacterized membrane protein HdeD (DUF308 family)
MKTIRLLAGILLIINGVLHIVLYLQTSNNAGSIGILVFGIIYIITGLFLFNKKRYPIFLGIIIPIIGMSLSLIKFGVPELISLSALFKVIGLIVIIFCGYIIVKQNKIKSVVQ